MYPCSLVRIPEQITPFALHSFNWFLFVAEKGSVHCAVRNAPTYQTNYVESLKGWPAVVPNKKNTGFWDRQVNCATPRFKYWTRWPNFANFDTQIRPLCAPEFATGWQTCKICYRVTDMQNLLQGDRHVKFATGWQICKICYRVTDMQNLLQGDRHAKFETLRHQGLV